MAPGHLQAPELLTKRYIENALGFGNPAVRALLDRRKKPLLALFEISIACQLNNPCSNRLSS